MHIMKENDLLNVQSLKEITEFSFRNKTKGTRHPYCYCVDVAPAKITMRITFIIMSERLMYVVGSCHLNSMGNYMNISKVTLALIAEKAILLS